MLASWQSAEKSKNVAQDVGRLDHYLSIKKNLVETSFLVGEKSLWQLRGLAVEQKKPEFASAKIKTCQNDSISMVFRKMQKNRDCWVFSGIFPIILVPKRNFRENFIEKSLSYKAGEFFVESWGVGPPPPNFSVTS